MGRYTWFVWGSFGLTLLALGSEVLLLVRRQKALDDPAQDGSGCGSKGAGR